MMTNSGNKAKHERLSRVHAIGEWMLSRLSDPPGIETVCHHFGITEYQLKHDFLEVYGSTVSEWFRCQRLRYAAEKLLTTKHTVTVIAEWVGYQNPSRFAEAFRAEFNASPSSYRKEGKLESLHRDCHST